MTHSKVAEFGDDALAVRRAFAQFPSGVAVLAVDIDGAKHALVASSFMVGVSLQPCLVATAIQKTSETWELINGVATLGVSIVGAGQGDLIRQLAGKDRAARFEEVAFERDHNGAVYIEDASLWLECSINAVSDAGDHKMVLLEVHRLGAGTTEPLVWHGATFRELAGKVADVA